MFTIQSLGHGERYLKIYKVNWKALDTNTTSRFIFLGSIISFGENGCEFELRYNNSEPQGEVLIQHWLRIWTSW